MVYLPNVKEHAPPPLESQETATEELNGGCRGSSCCALDFCLESMMAQIKLSGTDKLRFVESSESKEKRDARKEIIAAQSNTPKNQVFLHREDIPSRYHQYFEFVSDQHQACSRLAEYLENPPPYQKHCTKDKLWLVLDSHGDSVLWSDQELAVDAAVEALNEMTMPRETFGQTVGRILSANSQVDPL